MSLRTHRTGLLAALIALVVVSAFMLVRDTSAGTIAGFEIDASEAPSLRALYSGNSSSTGIPFVTGTGDDWADGDGAGGTKGAFRLSTSEPHDLTDCYNSNIDFTPAAELGGTAIMFCDGNADSAFSGGGGSIDNEPELNVVSPSGKTQDNVYPVTPGSVPGKNDFSHAYFMFVLGDSICDEDLSADDPFMIMAGHRGGQEGSAFWGFELNQVAPASFDDLKDNTGTQFDLMFQHEEGTNSGETATGDIIPGRTDGDVLVSFTLVDGGGSPILEVFRWDSTNASATPLGTYENLALVGGLSCQDEPAALLGSSVLATNALLPDGSDPQNKLDPHSIEAPPWNVPACDPTPGNSSEYGTIGDGGGNSCRYAFGSAAGNTGTHCGSTGQNTPADCHLLPTLTFAEAAIDMNFFGIGGTCFSTMIFTSRSSQTLGDTGSDLKDIGGGEVDICGSKSGRKFEDLDGDHTDDGGTDPGLEGWTINLYEDAGTIGTLDAADTFLESQVTDSNGEYEFTGLNPGDYLVCEVISDQTGWVQTYPETTTTDSADCTFDSELGAVGHSFEIQILEAETGNDFGNFELFDKSGKKVEDLDGDDNITEDASNVLEGWDIKLYDDVNGDGDLDSGDTLLSTDTTAADGTYSFEDLGPGDYIVCEVLEPGWVQTAPTSGADCSFDSALGPVGYAFSGTSGTDHENNDFGNFELVEKRGTKFEDLDGDGDISEDSANTLSGWDINIYADDGSVAGDLDAGDTFLTTETTDSNGDYEFDELGPGSYIVCEVMEPGWVQTYPTSGADCSVDSTLGSVGYAFTTSSGTDHENNDFGNFELVEKRGNKYEDNDGDGSITEDSGDPQSGWTIKIYTDDGSDAGNLDAGDTFLASDVTEADGSYEFANLGPGSYIVCEVLQTGWIQTYPTSGADCTADSTFGAFGYAFTTSSGTDHENNDFGNFKLITKAGTKFKDANGDGDLTGDTGLEGWTINIYEDAGTIGTLDAADTLITTDVTDSNGDYSFPNLGPGSYIVCEVAQEGWEQTVPASGADCTFDPLNSPIGYAFTASSGVDHLENDFANTELFRLIIITCSEATETLVVSEVDPDFVGPVKDTIGTPPALSGKTVAELQAYLCNLGGAQYEDLPRGTYGTDTEIPKVP